MSPITSCWWMMTLAPPQRDPAWARRLPGDHGGQRRGLAPADRDPPDLVLLDIGLPAWTARRYPALPGAAACPACIFLTARRPNWRTGLQLAR
jgi:hypothetical protein